MRNSLFTSNILSRLSEGDLFEVLGPVQSADLVRIDGKPNEEGVPRQIFQSAGWNGWPHDDEEDDYDICLIDLGHAFLDDAAPQRIPQPSSLQVPETIFMNHIDHRLDLWRIGIVVRSSSVPFFDRHIVLISVVDLLSSIWATSIYVLYDCGSGQRNGQLFGRHSS